MSGFWRSASSAASLVVGREQHVDELLRDLPAELGSDGTVEDADHPNADIGSAASARSYASSIEAATATPHGFACLTITQAGSSNSRSSMRPAFRS